MPLSAQDVEQELLEVLHLEAERLLAKARSGEPLDKGDRINLSYYLRAATDAARAELDRVEKLDPERLSDELLGKLLAAAGIKDQPAKRKRSDG